MADSTKEDGAFGSSWWGGWVQAAKDTSAQAMEFVRKDLGEFTCTVQADTEHAVQATSHTVKETLKAENATTAKSRMKDGINSLFQGLTKALTIPPDDEGQKAMMVVSSESAIYDRSKARLHAIQVDPGTYLNEPTGPKEHFTEWCKHFDIDTKKGDVSELLVSKVEVRALFTKLVPAQISHAEFWQRYFYKLHQMALDEARKQALIKRAERSRTDNNSINDDWSGDEDMEIVELPMESPGTPKKEPSPVHEVKDTKPVNVVPEERDNLEENAAKTQQASVNGKKIQEKKEQPVPLIAEVPIISPEQPKAAVATITAPSLEDKPPSLPEKSKTETVPVTSARNTSDLVQIANNKTVEIEKIMDDKKDISVENDSTIKDQNNSAVEPEMKPIVTAIVQSDESVIDEEQHQVKAADAKVETECKIDKPKVEKNIQKKAEEVVTSSVLQVTGDSHLKTKEKGDMVVIGSDRESPTSESSGNKDLSTEEDWDKDFDLDVTEEDLKAAEELAKKMGDNLDTEDDDWENWE